MTRKKLIEVALPLEAINEASAREKSIRHGHPSTLHLWWARRPLAACRAVIFASLVDDPGHHPEDAETATPAARSDLGGGVIASEAKQSPTTAPPEFIEACRKLPKGKNATGVDEKGCSNDTPRMRLFDFIETLVLWESTTDERVLQQARELIRLSTGGNPPPLLDPFAGGGSIPLEAQRLGLEAHASDLNPVAVMINKALIEIPPRFANMPPVNPRDRATLTPSPSPIKGEGSYWKGAAGLAADVRYYGEWMRDKAWERIGHLYPEYHPHLPTPSPIKEEGESSPPSELGEGLGEGVNYDRWEIPPALERKMRDIARQLRKNPTPSEAILWQALRKRQLDGRKFRRQMAIGPFVVDFYCSSERLAVEVDGPIHQTQREADQARQNLIESLGIRFVRVTAEQAEQNLSQVLDTIRAAFLPSPLVGEGPGKGRTRGETVIAWLWARTVRCPNPACGAMMPLVRSFELSKKKGRRAWVEPQIDRHAKTVRFTVKSGQGTPSDSPKLGRGANFRCLVCGETASDPYIKDEGVAGRMSVQLMAIVTEGKNGRSYYTPTPEHEAIATQAKPEWEPQGELPGNARWFSPPLFGMTDFADLFTPRQLTALTTFSDLVAEARQQIEADALTARGEMATPSQPSPVRGGSEDSSTQRGEAGREATGSEATNLWTPTPVPNGLLEAARQLRRNMTDAEQILWQCLRRKQLGGFRFRKQHPTEKFVLDFYCAEARLAIELDGSQHNTPEGIAKDNERTAILEQHGIKVVRFWNDELFTNLEGVLQKIYEALQRRVAGDVPPPQPSPVGGGSLSSTQRGEAAGDMTPPQPSPARGGSEDSSTQRGEAGRGADIPLRDGGSGTKAYAEAVSVYLGMAVSRLSDIQNALCRWEISKTQVRNLFGRQAIPMVWDFAENNLFNNAAGDFCVTLETMVRVLERSVVGSSLCGVAVQEDATNLRNGRQTGISTDPPYYDNIGYADLSDFFYVWMRPSLRDVYPDIFGTMLVPKVPELIASLYRFDGNKSAAEQHFETGLNQTFAQLRQIIPPDYPLTVYYAFKQQEIVVEEGTASTGWETMLASMIDTGFQIVGTWPMRTELSNRMIASGTNALASSIVLVCRPRSENAPMTSRREFVNTLRRELPPALREMQSGNIAPVDLAQASIGPGMAVYSRYSKVLEPDGSRLTVRAALQLINHELDAYLAEQEGEIDGDSRFAVAWFEQFGFNEAGFGQADVLARAKNTSVDGLRNAGVLDAGAGKVRLLHWSELDPGWDPTGDLRLTVWEATHHLILELDTRGEGGAAQLLAKMPPDLAAEARQLAYRLYSICERKGWAEQARDYNALVISWSASQEQAVRLKEQYQQSSFFNE